VVEAAGWSVMDIQAVYPHKKPGLEAWVSCSTSSKKGTTAGFLCRVPWWEYLEVGSDVEVVTVC